MAYHYYDEKIIHYIDEFGKCEKTIKSTYFDLDGKIEFTLEYDKNEQIIKRIEYFDNGNIFLLMNMMIMIYLIKKNILQ